MSGRTCRGCGQAPGHHTDDCPIYERLESGIYLRREDVPYTPEEEAEAYGKGELKAFTRPSSRKDAT